MVERNFYQSILTEGKNLINSAETLLGVVTTNETPLPCFKNMEIKFDLRNKETEEIFIIVLRSFLKRYKKIMNWKSAGILKKFFLTVTFKFPRIYDYSVLMMESNVIREGLKLVREEW
jgi:hypothetical protein